MDEISSATIPEGIDIQSILDQTGFILSILSIILGFIYFRKLKKALLITLLFLLVSVSTHVLSLIIISNGNSNLFVINIYTLLEFSIFGWLYIVSFKKSKAHKLVISFTSIILITLIYLTLKQDLFSQLNESTLALEAISFILISIGYFYKILNDLEYNSPLDNPIFWVNSGVLVYFSGAFFFFIFSGEKYAKLGIWVVHSSVHVIFMSLILIGFWKTRKT